jgi:hypothetical protein
VVEDPLVKIGAWSLGAVVVVVVGAVVVVVVEVGGTVVVVVVVLVGGTVVVVVGGAVVDVVVGAAVVVVVVAPPAATAVEQSSAVCVAPVGTSPAPSRAWTVPLPSLATQMPYPPWFAGDSLSQGPPLPPTLGDVPPGSRSSPPARAALTPLGADPGVKFGAVPESESVAVADPVPPGYAPICASYALTAALVVAKSDWHAAVVAELSTPWRLKTTMPARIPSTAITMSNSMRVNPAWQRAPERSLVLVGTCPLHRVIRLSLSLVWSTRVPDHLAHHVTTCVVGVIGGGVELRFV